MKNLIRTYNDFPKKGIAFKDLNPIYAEPCYLDRMVRNTVNKIQLQVQINDYQCTRVIGIEARGFILGSALAQFLNTGFIPLRKKGKLPGKVKRQKYKLEYGTDEIEIQENNLKGRTVFIVDDVYATGGTMKAAIDLVKKMKPKRIIPIVIMDINIQKKKPKNMITLIEE